MTMINAAITDVDRSAARALLSTDELNYYSPELPRGAHENEKDTRDEWVEEDVEVAAQVIANARQKGEDRGYALCNRHSRK